MKEIVYIQAGQLANYIGTHFWNTQETYFTYAEDEESEVNHDSSFREGLTLQGELTYSPRLLLFDRRSNFGTLSGTSGLYATDEQDYVESNTETMWNGGVVEYRQDRIPPSDYHTQLDHNDHESKIVDDDLPQMTDSSVRFWSDHSRVFFHPRSLQRLPDLSDWENADGDWNTSKEAFERHSADTDLMDDSFRLLVEECDNLQGIQVMNDTTTFGGFVDSFLDAYRDEFPKLPCLSFPLLSRSLPGHVDTDDVVGMRKLFNDILQLHGLESLSTLSVPIQAPATWTAGEWLEGVNLNLKNPHQTSAILSAHIEAVTLPLRLKSSMEDFESLCGVLAASGNSRFGHLSGVFPLSPPLLAERDFVRRVHDFTGLPGCTNGSRVGVDTRLEFARIYVARGFSSSDRRTLDAWNEARRPLPYSILAPAYPLPSSFPSFLHSPPARAAKQRAPVVRVLSSLHTDEHISDLFSAYAQVVDDCVRRGADVLGAMGLEKDDVLVLRDELWAIRDKCAGLEEGDGVEPDDLDLDDDEE